LQIEFKNKALLQFYRTGKSRKYNLSQSVAKKFFMRIAQLEAAIDIYDLWNTPSLRFEKLKAFENRYAVRLTKQHRLEMKIDWENSDKTKGRISILELSKHYGD